MESLIETDYTVNTIENVQYSEPEYIIIHSLYSPRYVSCFKKREIILNEKNVRKALKRVQAHTPYNSISTILVNKGHQCTSFESTQIVGNLHLLQSIDICGRVIESS